MKKNKTYQTARPKANPNKVRLLIDPLARNEPHFETQLKTKAQTFDDRRKRKPKHKAKTEDFQD